MRMDYIKIGQRIRDFRKEKKMSQEQLAEQIGISPTHMSHIETGSTKLSLPVLVKLSQSLKVKTDRLLFDAPQVDCSGIMDLLSECSEEQIGIMESIIAAAKKSTDKYF